MVLSDHRPAREQCVAVLAVARDRIGFVDGGVALGRQELGLRHVRPAGELLRALPVHLAHFLQTDDVRIELFHGMAEIVDLQPPRQPDALHALVYVVSRHP